jgi:L-lactate dehydrogenase (cytochrome)
MKHITCIEDLRQVHMRKVPKAFFDYCDRGSYAEETLRANRDDLGQIKLRQRILVDVSKRNLATTILGEPAALPLILAPVGLTGMQYGDGEIHACRAAQAAGIPYTLSTMSICSIEDVAANVDKPFWFQLYVMKDRGFIKALVERAIAAKCSALVLTVDLQVIGQRHADIKNGMTVPPEWTLSKFIDFATKPMWVSGVLRGKRRTFGNLVGHLKGTDDITALGTWISTQFDTTLNWKDVEWIRSIWPGKLILKGILDVEDAEEAAKTEPRRPAARWRAIVNRGAAGGRRRGRLADRGDVRRRHPVRTGRDAGARAGRQIMHDRTGLYSRPRRLRRPRRRQGDRPHRQRIERDHGPVRRQHHRGNRRSRAGGLARERRSGQQSANRAITDACRSGRRSDGHRRECDRHARR